MLLIYQLCLKEAINTINLNINDIDYITYTSTPGLIGCLQMGKIFSETLGLYLNKSVIPQNHLISHLWACSINDSINFPALGVVISGGHTELYKINSINDFNKIGYCFDDAAGECLDKVGRYLGLNYPAGAEIEKLAQKAVSNNQIKLPIYKDLNNLNFSFSGLKSSAINLINKLKNNNQFNLNNFCFALQNAVINSVVIKIKQAIVNNPTYFNSLIIGGGVAANLSLKNAMETIANKSKLKFLIPKKEYCTDNAAMIGITTYYQLISQNNK